jgi:methionine synthase I (cobalamin-dependent)
MGQVKPEELRDAFAVQAGALADSGADGIVVETMSDLEEAKLAVAAALKTKLPVVACMTFDSGKDHDRARMCGTTPEQAAQQLTDVGADCIGSNCGQGIEGLIAISRRLKASTERPIWIKANAGLPELVGERTVYAQSPENFAAYVPPLVEVGASFIGGCCGTTPEFISAVKEKLKR